MESLHDILCIFVTIVYFFNMPMDHFLSDTNYWEYPPEALAVVAGFFWHCIILLL